MGRPISLFCLLVVWRKVFLGRKKFIPWRLWGDSLHHTDIIENPYRRGKRFSNMSLTRLLHTHAINSPAPLEMFRMPICVPLLACAAGHAAHRRYTNPRPDRPACTQAGRRAAAPRVGSRLRRPCNASLARSVLPKPRFRYKALRQAAEHTHTHTHTHTPHTHTRGRAPAH